MYILFETLRYQNFLATGNEFTEIKLNKSKSTLIQGKIGQGKSTILDALMFALYGKPYRNINKPLLVNSINKKNCLVEVEFSIGKKKYLIRRGISPDLFEIYINGSLLKQDAKSRDYQKQFIKNVLKISDKSFRQIVVLGSASYVPFMQLETYKRREIIEDLLEIQIFSTMNILLKDKINSNKSRLTEIDTQIKIEEHKIELSKKHINSLKANNDELIEQRNAKITSFLQENENLTAVNETLTEKIEDLSSEASDYAKLKSRLDKLNSMEAQLSQKSKQLESDIQFFHDNDNCPTCLQGIDHDFKTQTIECRSKKASEIDEAVQKLKDEYETVRQALQNIMNVNAEIAKLNSDIAENNSNISFNQKNISALNNEIEELKKKSEKIEVNQSDLKEHVAALKKANRDKEAAIKFQNILEVSTTLLKDTGIKSKIISQFVPIMNKYINKYLADLDFFAEFHIDENFNEVIKSRYRDEFTFSSFSEGEKTKINFSLLLTWRQIAKMRNSTSTNLLILDEVFDARTDPETMEAILNLLGQMENTNLFMISHNQNLFDKLHSSITFEKQGNFSKIVR